MKNGRFSEKKTGKRWFTSTWNASLSTWLKSGLTRRVERDRRRQARPAAEPDVGASSRRPIPAGAVARASLRA